MMQKSGFTLENMLVTLGTYTVLKTKKIPAPILVVSMILLGFVL